MPLTKADVLDKKGWIAEKVKSALAEKFNLTNVEVAHGLGRNVDGNPDFALRVIDHSHPDDLVGDDVLDYVTEKVQELVPESKPDVQAIGAIRFG